MAASSSGVTSDFARQQLVKYGWSEGKGLGKHEDGIAKPLRAKPKMNRMGVGCNSGDEFTVKWWEHVFDKAAAKITVQSVNGSDQVSIKSNDKPSKDKPNTSKTTSSRKEKYTNFHRESLLDDDSNHSEDNSHINNRISDEEKFRRCKGMTAHRAARHGLRMNGKLRRLELQEKSSVACSRRDLDTSTPSKMKRPRRTLQLTF